MTLPAQTQGILSYTQLAARYMRLETHAKAAYEIARKHHEESVAWDDVYLLLGRVAD